MFGSVRPSVHLSVCLLCILHYMHGVEWSIYGLGLLSAKENNHDT